MINKITGASGIVKFGADPEFFFTKRNKVIGAEKVLPQDGLKISKSTYDAKEIVVDGIQAEIHPGTNTCRSGFGYQISDAMYAMHQVAKKHKVKLNFNQGIKVPQKEMDSLGTESKQFGCEPSFNVYTKRNKMKIKDASKYLYRTAGGHIHMSSNNALYNEVLKSPERLVPILDIIVGNTCVLIDRDKANVERRENYGKAGEYRTPSYGIEYRTLSNFWLKNYALMSLVTALCRLSVEIVGKDRDKEILSVIKRTQIKKAINNNDYKLAMTNFKAMFNKLNTMQDKTVYGPLSKDYAKALLYMAEKGVNKFFPKNIVAHWIKSSSNNPNRYSSTRRGWESFADEVIVKKIPASFKPVGINL